MDEPAANAVVEILSPFVTRDILRAELGTVQTEVQAGLTTARAETQADLSTLRADLQADLGRFQLRIISFVAALNVGIATIAVAVATQVT